MSEIIIRSFVLIIYTNIRSVSSMVLEKGTSQSGGEKGKLSCGALRDQKVYAVYG
jgi:hypothetical protein